jgi:hypothetical protein
VPNPDRLVHDVLAASIAMSVLGLDITLHEYRAPPTQHGVQHGRSPDRNVERSLRAKWDSGDHFRRRGVEGPLAAKNTGAGKIFAKKF